MEDLTGQQLGPYRIVAPLGEGGMAAVYKAYQPGVDRYVALKVLPRHLAGDLKFAKRFQQEARTIANLQHINILPVHDYGQDQGYTYLVMPFVQTGTLADLLQAGLLPLRRAQQVMAQVGSALDYAHARGVIHRDIKPSNILVDEGGNCLLTDFGISKILSASSTQLTATGDVIGTPAYMSPEQGLGQELDPRSDLYSLGVVLYEMVTGWQPYRAETPMAVIIKHIHDPLPLPRTLNPDLPESLERLILKAMAKDREQRFKTAGEMVIAFNAALAPARGEPQQAEPLQSQDTWVAAGQPVLREPAIARPPSAQVVTAPETSPATPVRAPKAKPRLPRRARAGLVVILGGFLIIIWAIRIKQPQPVAPIEAAPEKPAVQVTLDQAAAAFATHPPTEIVAPSLTQTPKLAEEPVIYTVEGCMEFTKNYNGDELKLTECVADVMILPNGIMRFGFTWSVEGIKNKETNFGLSSDSGNRNMYLIDDLGNRLDHLRVGGDANGTKIWDSGNNGVIYSGWFDFPVPDPEATYFIFHDDDNHVQTPPIPRIWP